VLSKRDSNGVIQALDRDIIFTIRMTTDTSTGAGQSQVDEMNEAVKQEKEVQQMKTISSPLEPVQNVVDGLSSAADTWGPLLDKIQQFIAEV
jgi:hypothetical protein